MEMMQLSGRDRRSFWIVALTAVAVIRGIVGLGAAERSLPLVDAVKSGDVKAVRASLAQHVDVMASGPDGTTALHWAVNRDDLDVVSLLIRSGADVTRTNRYGVAPIMLACTNGNAAMIARLLGAGADPNTTVPGGETALMRAARTGRDDAVKLLLARGAQPNARESTRGQTALMWAAAQNNVAAMEALIRDGADIHTRSGVKSAEAPPEGPRVAQDGDAQKYNPPSRAFSANFYGSPQQIDGFTALLFAVREGHTEAVRTLLEAGANVDDVASNGTSALVIAAINAQWELGAYLLDRDANPNAAAQGWTALHQVARTRNYSAGHLPHPTPTGKLTGLDLARKLIERGADVNARVTKEMRDGYRGQFSRLGATAMLIAAKGSDHQMMSLLASNGADPKLANIIGTTVLMAAAGVDTLFPGEDTGTNEDGTKAVRVALDLGLDVNAVNANGETALHGAAFRGNNAAVQLLVDRGARLDAKNNKGMTPLSTSHADFIGTILQHQPETEALLRKIMEARGLPTDVLSYEDIRAVIAVQK